jgi:hypothetical protein
MRRDGTVDCAEFLITFFKLGFDERNRVRTDRLEKDRKEKARAVRAFCTCVACTSYVRRSERRSRASLYATYDAE